VRRLCRDPSSDSRDLCSQQVVVTSAEKAVAFATWSKNSIEARVRILFPPVAANSCNPNQSKCRFDMPLWFSVQGCDGGRLVLRFRKDVLDRGARHPLARSPLLRSHSCCQMKPMRTKRRGVCPPAAGVQAINGAQTTHWSFLTNRV
jgi:hypothetical protein